MDNPRSGSTEALHKSHQLLPAMEVAGIEPASAEMPLQALLSVESNLTPVRASRGQCEHTIRSLITDVFTGGLPRCLALVPGTSV